MEQHIGTLILLIILVGLSAFFSASETSYTSANRIRLKSQAEDGKKSAQRALKIIARYDKNLTTILIGNNIVNILTSSIATVMCIDLFGADLGSLISTVAVTIVVLIFGEILPKTIAKANAETFACVISGVMWFLMVVFTPLSAIFLLLQKAATKLFCSKDKQVSMTEQELISIIDEIEDEGVLEEQESSLVKSALTFDETLVSSILTPRVNIVAIELDSDLNKVRDVFLSEGYSRIPVYEKTIDHIVGVITHKDFFEKLNIGDDFYLRDILQETLHIPSLLKISDVLKQMQRSKIHLAVVVDQYGGTEGIVTLEDIIEELVGEIWDESDEITAPVSFINDNTFETGGDITILDFNRYFENRGMDIYVETDSNTLGGWLFELFGKIPEVTESVKTENFKITVLSLDNCRIGKLKFEILPNETTEKE